MRAKEFCHNKNICKPHRSPGKGSLTSDRIDFVGRERQGRKVESAGLFWNANDRDWFDINNRKFAPGDMIAKLPRAYTLMTKGGWLDYSNIRRQWRLLHLLCTLVVVLVLVHTQMCTHFGCMTSRGHCVRGRAILFIVPDFMVTHWACCLICQKKQIVWVLRYLLNIVIFRLLHWLPSKKLLCVKNQTIVCSTSTSIRKLLKQRVIIIYIQKWVIFS